MTSEEPTDMQGELDQEPQQALEERVDDLEPEEEDAATVAGGAGLIFFVDIA